uniref:CMRF35-like molecule 8 isoform X2 n=1 Tax=Geotrypetes seraphini TaxID=260995 RepID=A0A6P8R167_GEOSA|nr:CMRF35-like molecule 8 isoform X2 [Geotrypetes seraphini]
MKFFCIFSLILLPAGCWGLAEEPQHCPGSRLGDSVTVECHYEKRYKNSRKCWCKTLQGSCDVVLETTKQNKEVTVRRRFTWGSHYKNKFTVIMTKLTKEDTGTYSCGMMQNDECRNMCFFPVSAPPESEDTGNSSEENSSEKKRSTTSTSTPPGTSTGMNHISPTGEPMKILHILIPIILLLLFLVVIAVVLFIRTQRKKKEALIKDVAAANYENATFTQSPQRKVVATTVYVTAGPPACTESKPPHNNSQHAANAVPYYEEIQDPCPATHGRKDDALYCTVEHPIHVQQ